MLLLDAPSILDAHDAWIMGDIGGLLLLPLKLPDFLSRDATELRHTHAHILHTHTHTHTHTFIMSPLGLSLSLSLNFSLLFSHSISRSISRSLSLYISLYNNNNNNNNNDNWLQHPNSRGTRGCASGPTMVS